MSKLFPYSDFGREKGLLHQNFSVTVYLMIYL